MYLPGIIEICEKMDYEELSMLHGALAKIIQHRRKCLEVVNKKSLRTGSPVVVIVDGKHLQKGTVGIIEKVARKNAHVSITSAGGGTTTWVVPLSMLSECYVGYDPASS